MAPENNPKDSVELIPAFCWDCPECGRENFARTIVKEFSADEMLEMRLQMGIDPLQTGEFLTAPRTVECAHCGVAFQTVYFNAEQDA